MRLKLFCLISVAWLLNGCVGYDSVVKKFEPEKSIKVNNVLGAFGIALGRVYEDSKPTGAAHIFITKENRYSRKLGSYKADKINKEFNQGLGNNFLAVKTPPDLNNFTYFVNNNNVAYKIEALSEKLMRKLCFSKRDNLIEVLQSTYDKSVIHHSEKTIDSDLSSNQILVNCYNTEKYSYQRTFQLGITFYNPKSAKEYSSEVLDKGFKKYVKNQEDKKRKDKLKAKEYGFIDILSNGIQDTPHKEIANIDNVIVDGNTVIRSIGGKQLSIPTPENWFEVSSEMPKLLKMFEKITLPPNRVVAAFLPSKDKVKPKLNRYALVLTSKDAEKMPDLPASEFEWFKSQVKKQQNTLVERFKEKYGDSWSISDGASSSKFKIGKMTPMGVFIDKENAFAQSTIMSTETITGSSSSYRNVVVSAATLLIKGKMLNIQVTSGFRTETDAFWVKKKTRELVDLMLQAN